MTQGRLGKAAPAANTNTTVYTAPAGVVATVNVLVCNRGSLPAKVRLAVSETGVPASSDFIEFDARVGPNGVLERGGIPMSAGERIVVRDDRGACSYRVHGFEKAAP